MADLGLEIPPGGRHRRIRAGRSPSSEGHARGVDRCGPELLGKLIQASGAADWQELAAKMGASEDRLCVCVCVFCWALFF